jgi:hypothetical protein
MAVLLSVAVRYALATASTCRKQCRLTMRARAVHPSKTICTVSMVRSRFAKGSNSSHAIGKRPLLTHTLSYVRVRVFALNSTVNQGLHTFTCVIS